MSQTNTTAPASNPLAVEGGTITAKAGPVLVVVQTIRPNASFRLRILNADGFEIDELSQSFPFEGTARRAARTAVILFRAGFTVREVVAMSLAIREVAR
ncbi:MAG: hypothetical protein JWO67_1453 [Streptosporangiaceae bacterium]|nr:hypothetical protein [Streptosporangiaceae bacterium]